MKMQKMINWDVLALWFVSVTCWGVAIVAVLSVTGCGAAMHSGDHFVLSGTPEGIRAFGDTLNGAMKTAKEAPDAGNQYFQARGFYEAQVTQRNAQPGLFQKMFGSSEKAGS